MTAVERKQEGPTRSPTPNTRREYAKGENVARIRAAGPDNPMGLYALYIGRLYAIHGTNSNFGIGLRVSQGCIRLRNNDIKYLFDNVSPHARAAYRSACKVTTEPDGSRWVEVHEPLSRNRAEFESTNKVPLPITPRCGLINEGAGAELERRSGMPVKPLCPVALRLPGLQSVGRVRRSHHPAVFQNASKSLL